MNRCARAHACAPQRAQSLHHRRGCGATNVVQGSLRTLTRRHALSADVSAPTTGSSKVESHDADVVVIGAGIGGLCCAAMCAKYGLSVTVLESHSIAGGAAHGWHRDGYHFESGPSLYSGMASTGKDGNPLAHVLQAIGEPLDLIEYDQWNVLLPEGNFLTKVGAESFLDTLQQVRGPEAMAEWRRLQDFMRPFAAAASVVPSTALRGDATALATTLGRYGGDMFASGGRVTALVQPFSELVKDVVKDPFIKNWLDLLCFLLSGLPANGTIAAEVAFMFNEWYKPNSKLEFPRGGSQAMVDALVRGVTKRGGRVATRAHVERIMIDDRGRASGVRLRGGATVRARRAVVTNATLWDARRLLPEGALPRSFERDVAAMPVNRSFMHLHLGFDATGISPGLHHIVVNSWEGGVDTEQNVVLISIPSAIDPSMAPPGKHCLHAYYPATEPYAPWAGLDRRSDEYQRMKVDRSKALWEAVERVIPDIRDRVEVEMVGTPLTHERFLRRYQGSYGPGIVAGQGIFPGAATPIPGLLACGDSTFPGIGLPAVAASGAIAANTLVPVWDHWRLLDEIGI